MLIVKFTDVELTKATREGVRKIGLREKRKAAGLSINQVVALTGISKPSISLYENGKRNLSVKKAKVLARAYGCVWEELFEDDDDDGNDYDSPGRSRAV